MTAAAASVNGRRVEAMAAELATADDGCALTTCAVQEGATGPGVAVVVQAEARAAGIETGGKPMTRARPMTALPDKPKPFYLR